MPAFETGKDRMKQALFLSLGRTIHWNSLLKNNLMVALRNYKKFLCFNPIILLIIKK